jgi:glutathione peroxidase-family protein
MLTRRDLWPLLLPAAAGGAQFPRPAGKLEIKTLSGALVPISKYKGRVVAVEFLLTYCAACQEAARGLELLYQEFRPRGFQPIGAATNVTDATARNDLPAFVQTTNIRFPIGYVSKDDAQVFLQHPMAKILYFPQTALIDRKGRVRHQFGGDAHSRHYPAEIRGVIEKLLQES